MSRGAPVNDVQQVMGHEHAATTLELYTHASDDRNGRVLGAFADFPLTMERSTDPEDGESPSAEGL